MIRLYAQTLEPSTYLPGDNQLVSPSTDSADVSWVSVWLLRWRRAQRRRELTAFAQSNGVPSLDTEREISPRPQTNCSRHATCIHPCSFSEPILLIKWCVVVDDVLSDRSVVVTAGRPHYDGLQRATSCQSNVIRRVWSTCAQTTQHCQHMKIVCH